MTKVYRSNTGFQKVKYLSPICNSSKIIVSNQFQFQRTCCNFELTCLSGSYDQENYWNIYASLLKRSDPLTFSDFSIPSVNKEYFTHFLKCHSKAWFTLAMQAYARQCEHGRQNCRLSNASWRTTPATIKGGQEEIIRASCSG